MTLSIQVPDRIAQQLDLHEPESGQRFLESFAIEGYRSGELSRGQVSELLGLSFWETEALLKEHGCGLGLTFSEFEQSAERLRKFLGR